MPKRPASDSLTSRDSRKSTSPRQPKKPLSTDDSTDFTALSDEDYEKKVQDMKKKLEDVQIEVAAKEMEIAEKHEQISAIKVKSRQMRKEDRELKNKTKPVEDVLEEHNQAVEDILKAFKSTEPIVEELEWIEKEYEEIERILSSQCSFLFGHGGAQVDDLDYDQPLNNEKLLADLMKSMEAIRLKENKLGISQTAMYRYLSKVKQEPGSEDNDLMHESSMDDLPTGMTDDKKDIKVKVENVKLENVKHEVKLEEVKLEDVKPKIKKEIKSEVKREVKVEPKKEPESNGRKPRRSIGKVNYAIDKDSSEGEPETELDATDSFASE